MALTQTKKLNDGVEIPVYGFGTFQIPADGSTYKAVREALDLGIRHIDTAVAYFNEQEVGKAIRESGIPREEIFVTSKLWLQDYGYEPAKKGIETSLKKLGLDYMDLYLIHQPYGDVPGAWKAMEDAKAEGKIRSIGVSNMTVKIWNNFIPQFDTMPSVNQIEFNPYCQRKEMRSTIMDELQISRLPSNFYVYEISDYHSLNCKKEAENLLDIINLSKKEGDVQSYIKNNQKWFIPISIMKAYDFGHHFSCVVPEYQLGAEYRLDYLLIGKNSLGYQFVFVEFEDVNVDYRLKTANSETDKVRKGLNQIRDWKRWIEQHREYFLGGEGIREIAHNVPLWGFHYCLVVGRRDRMDGMSNQLRGELQGEVGVAIMSYDRLVDYVSLLHNGI